MTDASSWSAARAADHLKTPTGDDNKYSRGVVGVRTGSLEYPGAAVLGVEAAWRAGAGMVRYLGPDTATSLVLARRPETVCVPGRVNAWVVGSGMPARVDDTELVEIFDGRVPIVADAGAIERAANAPGPRVLTPHRGEFARLRDALGLSQTWSDDRRAVRETAAATHATVLLKGSRTWIATPGGWCASVTSAASWLSTAGTGDVLAGVVGALVAAHSDAVLGDAEMLGPLAASAAWLHGAAGRIASGMPLAAAEAPRGGAEAQPRHGHPIVALDVADALPTAWALAVR